MAEVVRKEPPVLIENVSLVINVFNIGHHGDVNNLSIAGQPHSRALLQQNGLIQGSTTTTSSANTIRSTTEASTSLFQKSFGTNGPEENNFARNDAALGWIALSNGDLIPFGVLPTVLEIPSFGDMKSWKEIRVSLPPSLLAENETDQYCPVPSCREKLPRNKSMDVHIKKHLGIAFKESQQIPVNAASNTEGSLPCPMFYYCQDKKCQYYVETGEKNFKAYKNVKQHYQKVHAPRLFECDQCQKTFSTQKVLETHKLMCGEKYSCSTCEVSYNTLESLQTHCRRKAHTYNHHKYKDKRNSVKQEMQSLKINACPPTSVAASPTSAAPSIGTGRKSTKTVRKLPAILPKGTTQASPEVLHTIQAFCQQAGVKVDLGCQTVCTAFIQKSSPVEASVLQTSSSASTPTFTQKKRKSTDTQTNIVKFRATCLDQKHNATNTNLDWKKVITSDSQTQTADSCETVELSSASIAKPAATDSSNHFNDVFATFKISEAPPSSETANSSAPASISIDQNSNFKQEPKLVLASTLTSQDIKQEEDISGKDCSATPTSSKTTSSPKLSTAAIKVDNGPCLNPEFISFLEAIDSATQTDPEMFDTLGSGECLGIRGLFGDDLAGSSEDDVYYVSVSSTASQTAVESVSSKSLSAEDYEALLNATDEKKIRGLNASSLLSEFIKSVDSNGTPTGAESSAEGGGDQQQQQGTNDFLYDWEHIVEEVYRDSVFKHN